MTRTDILLLLLTISANYLTVSITKLPIIFVPGITGSRLETKANHSNPPWFCPQHNDWTFTWLSFVDAIHSDCLTYYLKMQYIPAEKLYDDKAGFLTRPYQFGEIDGVYCLNPNYCHLTQYFSTIVDHLVSVHGYQPGWNIRAAPYDFRRVGDKDFMNQFFEQLTKLIEVVSEQNNGQPVILCSHSLGGVMTTHYLLSKYQKWKDRYVHSHISLAGAYGGSTTALEAIVFGVETGLPDFLINKQNYRDLSRTFNSLYFLLPSLDLYDGDHVIAMSDQRNYTLKEIPELLVQYGMSQSVTVMENVQKLIVSGDVGVKMACVYSLGVTTPDVYRFKDENQLIFKLYVDGDGTINKKGLEACLKYAKNSSKGYTSHVLKNVDHAKIVQSNETLSFLDQWLNEISRENLIQQLYNKLKSWLYHTSW